MIELPLVPAPGGSNRHAMHETAENQAFSRDVSTRVKASDTAYSSSSTALAMRREIQPARRETADDVAGRRRRKTARRGAFAFSSVCGFYRGPAVSGGDNKS
jgi:hypothetical protein